jgi:hypothetical protein
MPKAAIKTEIRWGRNVFSPEDDYEEANQSGPWMEHTELTALPTKEDFLKDYPDAGYEEDGDDRHVVYTLTFREQTPDGEILIEEWSEYTREDGEPWPETDEDWPEEQPKLFEVTLRLSYKGYESDYWTGARDLLDSAVLLPGVITGSIVCVAELE